MSLKAVLTTSALIAMAALPARAADLTVGFSQIGSESGWRAAETTVTKEEAKKHGVTLKFADAEQKQENQIRAIRAFIAQGVDAIFLAPVVATGWTQVLGEARDAKIPVFLLDRDIDPSGKALYMSAVTSDCVHEGTVGRRLARQDRGSQALPCRRDRGHGRRQCRHQPQERFRRRRRRTRRT